MATRLPIDLVAEFRGLKPAGTFTKKDTGEVVDIPAKLKLEVSRDDGDVDLIEISSSALDRATPPVEYGAFKRGELIRLRGEVMLQDRGSDRDSYLSVHSAALVTEKAGATLRQAA